MIDDLANDGPAVSLNNEIEMRTGLLLGPGTIISKCVAQAIRGSGRVALQRSLTQLFKSPCLIVCLPSEKRDQSDADSSQNPGPTIRARVHDACCRRTSSSTSAARRKAWLGGAIDTLQLN